MKWSVSGAKTFKRCQRQWFYKNYYGSARAKDAGRRSVFLLGKLQSISGWRGSLIDNTITHAVVPALQSNRPIYRDAVISYARGRFESQLKTALEHPLREPDRTLASWGDDYAAFHCVEYGDGPTQDELATAWREIESALTNLLARGRLLERLREAELLVPQRPLQFSAYGVSIVAVPDLIAFYREGPPVILDWKAHAIGTMDAWQQLTLYAMALKACNPHRDFPSSLSNYPVEAIRLVEVQLLLNRWRKHSADAEAVEGLNDFISGTATSMLLAVNGKKAVDLSVDDFATTSYESNCERCSFRKVCWETMQ
jgi:hypothetical protein